MHKRWRAVSGASGEEKSVVEASVEVGGDGNRADVIADVDAAGFVVGREPDERDIFVHGGRFDGTGTIDVEAVAPVVAEDGGLWERDVGRELDDEVGEIGGDDGLGVVDDTRGPELEADLAGGNDLEDLGVVVAAVLERNRYGEDGDGPQDLGRAVEGADILVGGGDPVGDAVEARPFEPASQGPCASDRRRADSCIRWWRAGNRSSRRPSSRGR